MPVFIYFYAVESTTGLNNQYKKPWLFFIPFSIFVLNTFFFKVYSLSTEMTRAFYIYFKTTQDFQSIFSFMFTLVLIVLSYRHIKAYRKGLKTKKSKNFQKYEWILKTLVFLFFVSLFWGFALFIYLTKDNYTIFFNLLWIALSVTIYYIGHIGIYKYGVAEERKNIRDFSDSLKIPLSTISTKKNVGLLHQKLVEEKQFLNPRLTLELLAKDVGLSTSHLSRIFNTELDSSFSDYINQLRVKQAKLYLSNTTFSNYTIVAIGLEAGFNSKTTFNTAFKKYTGKTPSEYRKEAQL
jgi:AraC-like DNA-binding protein